MFGIVELILSQLPDIHSLRFLNIFCTFCTIAFAVICFSVSIANGLYPNWLNITMQLKEPEQ